LCPANIICHFLSAHLSYETQHTQWHVYTRIIGAVNWCVCIKRKNTTATILFTSDKCGSKTMGQNVCQDGTL